VFLTAAFDTVLECCACASSWLFFLYLNHFARYNNENLHEFDVVYAKYQKLLCKTLVLYSLYCDCKIFCRFVYSSSDFVYHEKNMMGAKYAKLVFVMS